MLLNNRFSTKNKWLYKMKCINTRNEEYKELKSEEIDKKEKYLEKVYK